MTKVLTTLIGSIFVLSACIPVYAPDSSDNVLTNANNSGKIINEEDIHSFEDCIAAGNPAMESHPRQCNTKGGQHFVEDIEVDDKEERTYDQNNPPAKDLPEVGDEVVCTLQYDPVCGQVQVQCIKAPCPPLWTNFSNDCFAKGSDAKNIQRGTCESLGL